MSNLLLPASTRILLLSCLLVLPVAALQAQSPERQSVHDRLATPTPVAGLMPIVELDASDVGAALGIDPGLVISAEFGATAPVAYAVFDQAASGFPTQGSHYLVLSSGTAEQELLLNPANSGPSVANGGPSVPPAFDIAQLRLELNVPDDAASYAFDFKFFSTEYPVYVGSTFNDAFLVEVDESDFHFQGVNVIAPNNIVFDENGQRISINTTGAIGMEPQYAVETAWFPDHAATPTLTTSADLDEGATTLVLYFTIFDVSDPILDSAVFIDNFRFLTSGGGGTQPADNTPPVCSGSLDGDTFFGMATDLLSDDPDNRGIADLSLSGSNLVLQGVNPTLPDEPPFPESVTFQVVQEDIKLQGSGTVTATDGAGNTCTIDVFIPGDDPVCAMPQFSQSQHSNPNRVELVITDPEGIVSVNFTDPDDDPVLENFEASSPQMTSTDGIRFTPVDVGNPPTQVDFTLLATAQTARYFALIENTCGAELSIDPLYEFEVEGLTFALEQNYPNPFADRTEISFSLADAADVRVTVFDVLGRQVAVPLDARFEAGVHSLTWDGSGPTGSPLPGGHYLYRIEADGHTQTRSLTLLR